MLFDYVLYGIALILFIYIIVDLIRTRKFDKSDAIAAFGIVIAVILAQPQPSPNPVSTVAPSITEVSNWAISFEYRFPPKFWSTGVHEYTLISECPNIDLDGNGLHSGSRTKTFEVSEATPLLSGDVYLRLGGLRDGPIESNEIDKINPLQTTTAIWNLIEMTKSDAVLASTDCTITITWDGGIAKELTPGLPFQR